LAEGEKSVMELTELLGQRQPSVSQQLARLKSEDLVQARRNGKHIYYSLARDEVRDIILVLHAAFCGDMQPRSPAGNRLRVRGRGTASPRTARQRRDRAAGR
jgi:ArsR family transcriptional regulator